LCGLLKQIESVLDSSNHNISLQTILTVQVYMMDYLNISS
jgi:hypothetical protein